MLTRLLAIFLISVAVPAMAQHTATPPAAATTAAFVQQKLHIDSLVQNADTLRYLERAAFNGRARVGKYRVECFYDKPTKEIYRFNFLFITDSLNYSKVFYFKENTLIKV